ncbi:MAG: radical SAM protein, partial [Bacteroidota bacterium]
MSGIYIHIPFCKQACTYCDFYFSVDLGRKEEFLAALSREIELRADYLNGNEIKTIYIGGGTPSVLSVMELADILKKLHETHAINAHAEVTVEVNPDDCHQGYLKSLLQAGVNRLSIGVQSFIDDELQLMNRRHSAYKAKDILRKLPEWGFQNYSADLIYAFPSQALEQLKENLNLMVD